MDYATAKIQKDALESAHATAGLNLNNFLAQFEKGPMGLTLDAVRAMPEFVALNKAYAVAFATLRSFNGVYCKKFAKEIRAARAARFAQVSA